MAATSGGSTAFVKKQWFDGLLKRDLADFRYPVTAVYTWKNTARVCSGAFSEAGGIELTVNLSAKAEEVFFGGSEAAELAVLFRAYMITGYLRCISAAEDSAPESYFRGLVCLQTINDICSGRFAVHSPIIGSAPAYLRPIDIHCAIRALTRICLEHGKELPGETLAACGSMREQLLTYSRLPETEYAKGRTMYALLRGLVQLRDAVKAGRIDPHKYPLFAENGLEGLTELDLRGFAEACDACGCRFWAGAAVRLLACLRERKGVFDVGGFERLAAGISDFGENCAAYRKECAGVSSRLLDDNYEAVKRIARGMDAAFCGVWADAGALHYMC